MSTKTRTDRWEQHTTAPKPAQSAVFIPSPIVVDPAHEMAGALGSLLDEPAVCTHQIREALRSPLPHGTELVARQHVVFAEDFLSDHLGTTPKPKPAPPVEHFKYAIGYPGSYVTYDEAFTWSAIQAQVYKVMMSSYTSSFAWGLAPGPQGIITSNTLHMYSGSTATPSPGYVGGYTVMNALRTALPNVSQRVTHPVTGAPYPIENIVPDLNDRHGWTRDQIADWLDTLDVDLTFQPPQKEELAS